MGPVRVLVPTRGSPPGLRACRLVAELLRPDQAIVRLLTVLPEDLYPFPYDLEGKRMQDMPERLARIREAVEGPLTEPRRILEDGGHAPEVSHRFGRPPTEILCEIRDWGADLVVLGQWMARPVERWVTGSVFEKVMRHTDVPVLVVKYDPGRDAPAAGAAAPSRVPAR